jgi:hypothetical protein
MIRAAVAVDAVILASTGMAKAIANFNENPTSER